MSFNSYSMKISSHSNEDFNSKRNGIVDKYFLCKPEGTKGHDLSPNFGVANPRVFGSKQDFKLVIRQKYHKRHFRH